MKGLRKAYVMQGKMACHCRSAILAPEWNIEKRGNRFSSAKNKLKQVEGNEMWDFINNQQKWASL